MPEKVRPIKLDREMSYAELFDACNKATQAKKAQGGIKYGGVVRPGYDNLFAEEPVKKPLVPKGQSNDQTSGGINASDGV